MLCSVIAVTNRSPDSTQYSVFRPLQSQSQVKVGQCLIEHRKRLTRLSEIAQLALCGRQKTLCGERYAFIVFQPGFAPT